MNEKSDFSTLILKILKEFQMNWLDEREAAKAKAKNDIIEACVVPKWMANDPDEPVTQAEYVAALKVATVGQDLSKDELIRIRDTVLPKGEIRSLIQFGMTH